MSITFMPPLTNWHLSGEEANLSMYSRVNQVMQMASTMANFGLSIGSPLSFVVCIDGSVFMVRPIVEMMMKDMDITATTWNSNAVQKRLVKERGRERNVVRNEMEL